MALESPRCPQCGAPRRLRRVDDRRIYRCSDLRCSAADEPIPNDAPLTLEAIAVDMAQALFKAADDLAKRQGAIRRLASGLRQLDEGRQYLSAPEQVTLTDAARLLERLASAAERAKQHKRTLEADERRRVEQRSREALARLQADYNPPDALDLARTTLTLAALNVRLDAFLPHDLTGDLETAATIILERQGTVADLTARLRHHFDATCRTLAQELASRHTPLDTLLEDVRRGYDAVRDSVENRHRALLAHIGQALAIAGATNITPLTRRPRRCPT
jgi:hypothetical protein